MKVLVGCEVSGVVRDAFLRSGHDAWSCDLKPTIVPGPHIQGDILDQLDEGWDLMIAHPDCTTLTVAGNGTYSNSPLRLRDTEFVKSLFHCKIPKVAIENPIGVMSTLWQKPHQYIHPHEFGYGETKKTCLWLKGLKKLRSTHHVAGREQRIWKMSPTKDPATRKTLRSVFYPGIAWAMADQWGQNI